MCKLIMAKQTHNTSTAAEVLCAYVRCLSTPCKTKVRQIKGLCQLVSGALSAVPTIALLQKVEGGHAVKQLQASV